jgi:hypothetical protein
MKLTSVYKTLPIGSPKQLTLFSNSKSSPTVEPYSTFYYRVNNRVRDNGSEYSTSKKTDSSNGANNTSPESIKNEISESSNCRVEEQSLEDNGGHLDKQQLVESKNRTTYGKKRKWKEGNAYIEWRTITVNGKKYKQAFYHWKENENKYSKYIPKKLVGVIEEADKQKRPITEILNLLGIVQSSTNHNSLVSIQNKTSMSTSSHPGHIHTRRHKGEGSGYIQWKAVTVNGKQYLQFWYHYEFWNNRERLIKSSRYIPKSLLAQVIQLDADKASVQEILNLLGVII